MDDRHYQLVNRMADFITGSYANDQCVPSEIWEPAHLFFAMNMPFRDIATVCGLPSQDVERRIKTYLVGLLGCCPEARHLANRLLGPQIDLGPATRPNDVDDDPDGLAARLLASVDAVGSPGWRLRETISAILVGAMASPPPELSARVVASGAQRTGPVSQGPFGSATVLPSESTADACAGPSIHDQSGRAECEASLRRQFSVILNARSTGRSERASKLIYGIERRERESKPDPSVSVFFVQNHLPLLERATRDDLPGYPGSRVEKTAHKTQTVIFGLMCYEVASGCKGFDVDLWAVSLDEGMRDAQNRGTADASGLVLQCSQDSQELLFAVHDRTERRAVLRRILHTLGAIVALLGGSWRQLSQDLQKEHVACGPEQKRVLQLHRELERCRRKSARARRANGFGILPGKRAATQFDQAIIVAARDSRFCRTDMVVDVCSDRLQRAGLRVTRSMVPAGDNGAFSDALRWQGPYFGYAEGSDFLGDILVPTPKSAHRTTMNRNTILVHRTAVEQSERAVRDRHRERAGERCVVLDRSATPEAPSSRPGGIPRVVEYVEEDLPQVMDVLVHGLPDVHVVDIEMSDEQGTLAMVVSELAALGCNIVACNSQTLSAGGVARFQVVVELPPELGWPQFETRMANDLRSRAGIIAHEAIFQPRVN